MVVINKNTKGEYPFCIRYSIISTINFILLVTMYSIAYVTCVNAVDPPCTDYTFSYGLATIPAQQDIFVVWWIWQMPCLLYTYKILFTFDKIECATKQLRKKCGENAIIGCAIFFVICTITNLVSIPFVLLNKVTGESDEHTRHGISAFIAFASGIGSCFSLVCRRFIIAYHNEPNHIKTNGLQNDVAPSTLEEYHEILKFLALFSLLIFAALIGLATAFALNTLCYICEFLLIMFLTNNYFFLITDFWQDSYKQQYYPTKTTNPNSTSSLKPKIDTGLLLPEPMII